MHLARMFHALLVALSIGIAVGAAWYDIGGFVARSSNAIAARQAADQNGGDSSSSTSTDSTSSTTTPSTSSTSTTPSTTPTSTPSTSTTATTTTPTSAADTTSPTAGGDTTSADTTPSPTSTGDNTTPADTTAATTTTTNVSAKGSVVTSVIVETTTDSSGQATKITSSAVYTATGSLTQSSSSSSSGMSTNTKNTIIGVCVGVGGAIVLAVVGLLVWRLKIRKNNQDDNEDLVDYGAGTSQFTHGGVEKDDNGSPNGRSPFQSTLESYHAPASTNAASNF